MYSAILPKILLRTSHVICPCLLLACLVVVKDCCSHDTAQEHYIQLYVDDAGFGAGPFTFGATAPAAPATSTPDISFGGAAQQSASAPASGGPFAFGGSTASAFAPGTSSNIGSFGNTAPSLVTSSNTGLWGKTAPSLANGSAPGFGSTPGQGGFGIQGVSANGGSVTAPSMTGGSTAPAANGGFGNPFNSIGQTGSAPGAFGGGFGGMAQGQSPAGSWGQMGASTPPAIGFGGNRCTPALE